MTEKITPSTTLADLHRAGRLSTRGFFALRAAGGVSLADVAQRDLRNLPNAGRVTRREIAALIERAGLKPLAPPPRPDQAQRNRAKAESRRHLMAVWHAALRP